MKPYVMVLVVVVAFAGCSDGAVTDPLREAEFEADPTPILGTWIRVTRNGSLDERFPLVIERDAGTLFGEAQLPDLGETVQLFFSGVDNWDGASFHFFDSRTFGLDADSLRWDVRFTPSMERVVCRFTDEERVLVRPARITVGTRRINIGATYRRPGTTPPEDPPLTCPAPT